MSEAPTAAVVGAGLSGLTAAYRLKQTGWDVSVFESTPEVGGRVRTVEVDGYLVDIGATALAASYDGYKSFVAELGEEVHPCPPEVGIFRDGEVHHLRMDHLVRSGLSTKLLSPRAKLRAARLAFDVGIARARGRLDYADLSKSAPLDTETAHDYAARALGDELETYLVEPIVRTMLIADPEKISKVELFSGVANIFASRVEALVGGQGRVPRLLADRVGVELSCPVQQVAERGDGVEVTRTPGGSSPITSSFDACVISCPLPVAVEICPDRAELLEPLDRALDYTQCITVAVGTTRPTDSPAFLVQMPAREDRRVALMFLDHNKCADRAPSGHGLIGCCWETDAARRMMDGPDEPIVEATLASVMRVFPELAGSVEMTHVHRWRRALPRTDVGGYQAIGDFNARLDPGSRIQFAADFMSAAGQNTAVEFGSAAASALQGAHGRGAGKPLAAASSA